jgi:hypothetical protein
VFGARAVRKSVIEGFPDADISVSIVWINMLPGDDEEAGKRASQIIHDPRVHHFYDPGRQVGEAVAGELLMKGAGPAWDIYLFYRQGIKWTASPPRPTDWMHQLGGGERADPARYRPGKYLVKGLHEAMERLAGG